MQESDTKSINELVDLIAGSCGMRYKPSEYVSINLIPPVILILQLIEMTLSSVGNITGVFTNMNLPIDPYFFLKQYVPHIDWDAFQMAANKRKGDDLTKTTMGAILPGMGGMPGQPM